MKITAAVIKEQNVTFTVVLVKNNVIASANRENVRNSLPSSFPRPIVLAEKHSNGRMKYNGRTDIVKFLSKVDYRRLPWNDYNC